MSPVWTLCHLARPERLDDSYAASSPLCGSASRNAARSSDRTLEFECYPKRQITKKGPMAPSCNLARPERFELPTTWFEAS